VEVGQKTMFILKVLFRVFGISNSHFSLYRYSTSNAYSGIKFLADVAISDFF
jgi:hypothetical protein